MRRALLLSLVVAAAAAGCGERLENIVGCPALCPQEVVDIETVTIEPVVFDTTVLTPRAPGSLPLMLLANRGDTLDTRVVIRFDTIPGTFVSDPADPEPEPITEIHDAVLTLRITTEEGVIADPTTIEAFNVDTTVADTAFTELLTLFRPDRFLGSVTIAEPDLTGVDSLQIPISSDALLPIVQSGGRLRVGLRVSGPTSVSFHVFALETGLPGILSFRPSVDTTVARLLVPPVSLTPDAPAELRGNLADFVIFAVTPPLGLPTDLNVGGLPAQRSYLRFFIPPFILDSSTVVRATLLLTQRPNPTFGPADTMGIAVHLVLAGAAVTDIARASVIVADPEVTGVDTVRTVPAENGVREFDIATFVRFWAAVSAEEMPHALVLASTREHGSPFEARFFSTDAAPELRPRLRISFAPRQPVALP